MQVAAKALSEWDDDVGSAPAQSDHGDDDSGLSPSVHTVGSWNKLLRVHSHLHKLLANPLLGKARGGPEDSAAGPGGGDAAAISPQWLQQVKHEQT